MKKQIFSYLTIAVIAFSAALAMVSCGGGSGANAQQQSATTVKSSNGDGVSDGTLIGTWKGGADDDELEFALPNIWGFGGFLDGTYTSNGSNLTFTYQGKQGTAKVTINDNTLTISEISGAMADADKGINKMIPGTYQRAGAERQFPTDAKLADYGLSGMSQTVAMTSIRWNERIDSGAPVIHITFNGTDATDAAIKNWFTSSGWTVGSDESYENETNIRYIKGNVVANYAFGQRRGFIISGKDR